MSAERLGLAMSAAIGMVLRVVTAHKYAGLEHSECLR